MHLFVEEKVHSAYIYRYERSVALVSVRAQRCESDCINMSTYMSKKPISLIAFTLFSFAFVGMSFAEDETDPATQRKISFFSDIRPIFQLHCNGCHQPAKQGGKYVMTSFESLSDGGDSGDKAIIPGDAASSHLIQMITPTDGQSEMPKGKKKSFFLPTKCQNLTMTHRRSMRRPL